MSKLELLLFGDARAGTRKSKNQEKSKERDIAEKFHSALLKLKDSVINAAIIGVPDNKRFFDRQKFKENHENKIPIANTAETFKGSIAENRETKIKKPDYPFKENLKLEETIPQCTPLKVTISL